MFRENETTPLGHCDEDGTNDLDSATRAAPKRTVGPDGNVASMGTEISELAGGNGSDTPDPTESRWV